MFPLAAAVQDVYAVFVGWLASRLVHRLHAIQESEFRIQNSGVRTLNL